MVTDQDRIEEIPGPKISTRVRGVGDLREEDLATSYSIVPDKIGIVLKPAGFKRTETKKIGNAIEEKFQHVKMKGNIV